MDQSIINDIKLLIYENSIEPAEVYEKFISHLDNIERAYIERAEIRTRNKYNNILTSGGRNYFTFVEKSSKMRPDTIFAGTLAKSPRSNKAPVVRVTTDNEYLAKIPSLFKYPFEKERNPGWTNVIISLITIEILGDMLFSEVEYYFDK
jgi:hypothetical protein